MAQRRRKEQQMKKRQRTITALCIAGGLGAALLSLTICVLIFDPFAADAPVSAPAPTALPYSASQPFSLADLTAAQVEQIRRDGSMTVSDGPRGVSVGDTLEELMECLPSTIVKTRAATDQTGLQSDEQVILYCADYFENQNGLMTVLPPRGLIDVSNGTIVVTLLAPTSAYPAGTLDDYGAYEHVYCVYKINPETMTISSITLGIDQ